MSMWLYASVMYVRIFCIPGVALGLIGDLLTIYIFSTVSIYRRGPSTFYSLCAVISNFLHLTIGLISRVVMVGFDNDLTSRSLFWCKARQYFISTYPPLGIAFESLAILNQYLATSRNVRLQQYSNLKTAHRVVVGFVIFWHVHSIPFLIYNEIKSNKCIINNEALSIYWSYIHFFVILMMIPTVSLATFGFLAYRNIRNLPNTNQLRGADRQLIVMFSLQLVFNFIATSAFGIYNAYTLATANKKKSPEQIERDISFLNITSLLGIFHFGGSFYIFMAVSSRFRQTVRQRVFCCFQKRNRIRHAGNVLHRIK